MHSDRSLHRQRPSFVGPMPPQGASTLSDVRGALELVEDNLRRNVVMSQHPSVRQAHEASGGLLSQPSGLELKQQKDEETLVRKRQQQAMEQLRSTTKIEEGSDAMATPFLAGSQRGSSGLVSVPPAMAAAQEAIAQKASKQFETMLLASVRASSSPRSASPPSRSASGSPTAAPIGALRPQPLRHPSTVPISQYVKTQLAALRYSLGHGYTYHEAFDQHAVTSIETRRVVQGLQPARAQCSVNFIVENSHQEQSVTRLLANAAREEEMKVQRRSATTEEIADWFNSQIELKRELVQSNRQRHRAQRRGSSTVDETVTMSASGLHQQAGSSDNGPLAALTASGPRATEREVATAVQSFWLALVAMATRTIGLRTTCDELARSRRAQTEQDTRRRRLDTEHMQALVALDTMKRKYDKCRVILRGFVQHRVRAKHHASVDLILRVLRHRHRMVKTNYQVRWYRRSVVIGQRQVRVFLQSLAARRMLLHLQWLHKECQLLQVPNMALYMVHQQWAEQRRVVDTTRLMGSGIGDTTPKRGGVAAALAGVLATTGASTGDGQPKGTATQQQPLPIRKPGGREFVIWHTRVTWVPPGGVPLEYRTQQVNNTAQSLIRSFVSALLSADANRRFFVKQKARYETDGQDALGLPRPRLPPPPIYRLFMPSTTLRMTVGMAQKERGERRGDQTGHHTSSSVGTLLPATSAKGGASKSAGAPCADQGLEAPGRNVSAIDGRASSPRTTKLPIRRASPRAALSTVALAKATAASKRCNAPDKRSDGAAKVKGQDASTDALLTPQQDPVGPAAGSKNAVSQWNHLLKHQQQQFLGTSSGGGSAALDSPLRKRGSVTLLPSSPLVDGGGSHQALLSPSPPPNAAGGRRSVFEHFDNLSGNEQLPSTVRSDADYAALLGKPSVHAMRSFLETKNTLHLRGIGRSDEGRERTRLQRAAASGSPSLPMHLGDINHHYQEAILKDYTDSYHIPCQPLHGAAGVAPPSPRQLVALPTQAALPKPLPPTARSNNVKPHRAVKGNAMVREGDGTSGLLGGDTTLLAHRPAAPGVITRRQHEERLRRFGPEAPMPSPMEAFTRPQAAMGSDVERDVPRLLAFSGSSDAQRTLMVLGGRRYTTSVASSPRGVVAAGSSSTARRPVEQEQHITAVPLLEGVAEARHRATARVRSLNFV